MKDTLKPGLEHTLRFRLPESKMVPALYPESTMFQQMPSVFATGFMVGLIEWACIEAIKPHLDWPAEQSLGTQISVSHLAATPAGTEVTVVVRLTRIDGRKLCFDVEARDPVDCISRGTHERYVIEAAKFNERLQDKMLRLKPR